MNSCCNHIFKKVSEYLRTVKICYIEKLRRWSFDAVTDGALAKSATAVGKSSFDDRIHSEAQRNDGQSAREYLPWTYLLNFIASGLASWLWKLWKDCARAIIENISCSSLSLLPHPLLLLLFRSPFHVLPSTISTPFPRSFPPTLAVNYRVASF